MKLFILCMWEDNLSAISGGDSEDDVWRNELIVQSGKLRSISIVWKPVLSSL